MRNKSLIALTLSTAFFLFGCESKEQVIKKEMAPIPVIAATPEIKDITVYLETIGTLKPSVLMEIRPQTSGTLKEVMINEGQTVKKGDPLFQIDPQAYEIRVLEAEAQFEIDQASLKAVQKKMSRFKDLAERNLIAQTEWDDLKAQLQIAQASIDLDSARLKYAKLDLEHCTLKSPVDGRVGILDASEGLLVLSGQIMPLAVISKMDPLLIEFTVTEKEFPLIPKDSLQIKIKSLTSFSEESTSGLVTFLDNHFDNKTGLLLVRGKIDNPDLNLRPGQSVRVQIPLSTQSNAKVIPQKAIRYNQQGPYIYIVNDDQTVSLRQLVLGKEHGTDQIVLEGLEATERVILNGHLRLSPGLKVEIKS